MAAVDLVQRLAELEQRVAALEGDERETVVLPEAEDGGGAFGYGGRVALGDGRITWRIDVTPERALALADRPRIEVLSALAHPVRVEIVRTLLAQGGRPATALQEAAGLGSTGQLYHHLKALTAAGVVEQDKRGSYRLRTAATIPVLVLLTAASDVAGQLRS
ncbi:DNA-binding transcriptional ArsR family regulator [Saccharothrix ecbatanensis]|jgi:DNA-binding transcriptional ArsR family regulator|uniref:DNA-binding transcriptional ArsR family regulator n=1 Tax=Saccharothrix ecbatanensis TaxID=1105145 RepID=A0A7W9HTZ9_9PSEU|nr:helix-turn-helix domain-containing protein [Saccharothrix ecbatanensis]MBB5808429.1 DNA-binding transcriptional ArsR family regulator [Saccharothrix ecbatanensis]